MTTPEDKGALPEHAPQGSGNAHSWVDDVLGGSGKAQRVQLPGEAANLSGTADLKIPDSGVQGLGGALGGPVSYARLESAQLSSAQSSSAQIPAAPVSMTQNLAAHLPPAGVWGEPLPAPPVAQVPYAPPYVSSDVAQKKLVAGLLAIFLGSLGVHKFYLGMNTPGVVLLATHLGVWFLAVVLGLLMFAVGLFITLPVAGFVSTVLGILGLVEGIIYLTKSDADFERDYLIGKKPWF